jgi:hypothetical protein
MELNNMKKIIVTPQGIQELNLTSEEIAQREQDAIQAEQEKLAREQEQANKISKKQEAEAIMEQLGLTKEHLKALGL